MSHHGQHQPALEKAGFFVSGKDGFDTWSNLSPCQRSNSP